MGKEKTMKTIINLESVGCAFNTKTGMVSPLCSNGEIDFVNELHLSEHSDEWNLALSDTDFQVVANYLTNN
jgi:hypothetical protein